MDTLLEEVRMIMIFGSREGSNEDFGHMHGDSAGRGEDDSDHDTFGSREGLVLELVIWIQNLLKKLLLNHI